jgi:hypothetical protein
MGPEPVPGVVDPRLHGTPPAPMPPATRK